jgi:hypothetical protein
LYFLKFKVKVNTFLKGNLLEKRDVISSPAVIFYNLRGKIDITQ